MNQLSSQACPVSIKQAVVAIYLAGNRITPAFSFNLAVGSPQGVFSEDRCF